MSEAKLAVLPDRGVVSVTGEDAGKLLAGIVTNDIDRLDTQPAIFAGLLSPQGKVLFDFLVIKNSTCVAGTGYLLDLSRDRADDLVKRLVMYRLRAKAGIENISDRMLVQVSWGPGEAQAPFDGAAPFADPRHPGLGMRWLVPRPAELVGGPPPIAGANVGLEAEWHAHRIALGVPEGGKDYDFGDAFPHEANFDLLAGVAFDKGCYVGQEIVARMQHRGTVRKRVVRVTGAAALPASRPEIKLGDVAIGRLGSVADHQGLALLRLDRAIEAIDKSAAITADGIALEVDAEMIARQRKLMAEKAGGA